MRQLARKLAELSTPGFALIIALLMLMFTASEVSAYETYSGCEDCHGDFRDSPYISLADGTNWGNDLHDIHAGSMLSNDCNVCHTGQGDTVFLGSSTGGTGLSPISCVGCHGREADMGNDSVSAGRGAGLRQHHTIAGQMVCQNCHSDANTSNFTPVGEDVLPDYFADSGMNHPNIPTDSCNPAGEEDFAGASTGLDNDGDGLYDTADSDCGIGASYTVGGNVTGLSGDSLSLQNNAADTLVLAANGPFTFATALEDGSAYDVTVSAQPSGQTCKVSNGSGTITSANVSDVAVTCSVFKINFALSDAWYDPATDGQGFFIAVLPDLGVMTLAWFTYDTELPPDDATANLGDPGHRWMTALGPYVDNQAVLNIEMTSGGIFDTPVEVDRTDPPGSDGTLEVIFDGCGSGTIKYDIPSINSQGIVPIQRVAGDNIAVCEEINQQ